MFVFRILAALSLAMATFALQPNVGARMDDNGLQSTCDRGAAIDPNGGDCTASSDTLSGDKGLGLDPNG